MFWQTRSIAATVLQLCGGKVHLHNEFSKKGNETLCERLSTPRPAPKIILKSAQQSQQQQQQQQDTSESASSRLVQRQGQGTPTRYPQRRSTWKQVRSTVSLAEKEEPEFKVDLRIEGIAQYVILEDAERTDQNSKSG